MKKPYVIVALVVIVTMSVAWSRLGADATRDAHPTGDFVIGATMTVSAAIERSRVEAAVPEFDGTSKSIVAALSKGPIPAKVTPESIHADASSLRSWVLDHGLELDDSASPAETHPLSLRVASDGTVTVELFGGAPEPAFVSYREPGSEAQEHATRTYCVSKPTREIIAPTAGNLGCVLPMTNDHIYLYVDGTEVADGTALVARLESDGSIRIFVAAIAP